MIYNTIEILNNHYELHPTWSAEHPIISPADKKGEL
jgi:hypothetical protein